MNIICDKFCLKCNARISSCFQRRFQTNFLPIFSLFRINTLSSVRELIPQPDLFMYFLYLCTSTFPAAEIGKKCIFQQRSGQYSKGATELHTDRRSETCCTRKWQAEIYMGIERKWETAINAFHQSFHSNTRTQSHISFHCHVIVAEESLLAFTRTSYNYSCWAYKSARAAYVCVCVNVAKPLSAYGAYIHSHWKLANTMRQQPTAIPVQSFCFVSLTLSFAQCACLTNSSNTACIHALAE